MNDGQPSSGKADLILALQIVVCAVLAVLVAWKEIGGILAAAIGWTATGLALGLLVFSRQAGVAREWRRIVAPPVGVTVFILFVYLSHHSHPTFLAVLAEYSSNVWWNVSDVSIAVSQAFFAIAIATWLLAGLLWRKGSGSVSLLFAGGLGTFAGFLLDLSNLLHDSVGPLCSAFSLALVTWGRRGPTWR